jgi:hypothetical protein
MVVTLFPLRANTDLTVMVASLFHRIGAAVRMHDATKRMTTRSAALGSMSCEQSAAAEVLGKSSRDGQRPLRQGSSQRTDVMLCLDCGQGKPAAGVTGFHILCR